MLVYMYQNTPIRPGPFGKERTREIKWDPVNVDPLQLIQSDVAVGYKRKGGKEVLAELPVSYPYIS
jgi:hypothetical protein